MLLSLNLGFLAFFFRLFRFAYCETPLDEDPLRAFSIYEPVVIPGGVQPCTIQLVQYVFANSYGAPAVVNYTPPSGPGCDSRSWSKIVLNFTGSSQGVQYDRLAHVYINNTEIFRTSTPEPTALGIIWTAYRDVTHYSKLFSQPSTIIVDLGNLLDPADGLTGVYNVTLSALFYPATLEDPAPVTADAIIPISAYQSSSYVLGGAASVPPSLSSNITLPRNTAKAFVEIFATGDSNEEFWYGNVPDQYFYQLPTWSAPDGYANPHGPFREVQLLIDGRLTGFCSPYPVIYTGEFLPSIWQPFASVGAFDSPSYFIDITTFLPLICDGKPHNFTITVIGMGPDMGINSDWIVSGNILVVLDLKDTPTKGTIMYYSADRYAYPTVTGSVVGPAPNVSVTTEISRQLTIEAEVITGSGYTFVKWEQSYKFSNTEDYQTTLGDVSVQIVSQTSIGQSSSTHNGLTALTDIFQYPLDLSLTYFVEPSNSAFFDYGVYLSHSYIREYFFGPGSGGVLKNVNASQTSNGTESSHDINVTIRTGNTSEGLIYRDSQLNTYDRNVGVTAEVNITSDLPRVTTGYLLYDEASGNLVERCLTSF